MASRVRSVSERGNWLFLSAGLGLVLIVGAVAWFAFRPPPTRGDSAVLVRSSAGILDCIRHGTFTHCVGAVRHGSVRDGVIELGPYPLFQYVPAVALHAFGVSTESTLRTFVLSNFASLLAVFALAYGAVKRLAPPLWAPLIMVALLASPLLFYGRLAFGEELAALLILGAVVGVLLEVRPLALFALVTVACLTKETNPPFIFALTAVCTLTHTTSTMARRRQLRAITLGTTLGICLNAGFNVFRYGTLANANYTRAHLNTVNPAIVSRQFAAQWFAPNGGLVWFWPLAPALILTLALISWRRGQGWTMPRVAVPLIALLFALQLLLLATWWAPFGWYAWGPRLILPLIPGMLVAACVLSAPYATRPMARLLKSAALLPLAVVIITLGLAQALVVLHGRAVTQFFGNASDVCVVGGSIFTAPNRYHHCLMKIAWSKRPTMLELGMRGFHTTAGPIIAVAFIAAVVSLLLIARRAAFTELSDKSRREQHAT